MCIVISNNVCKFSVASQERPHIVIAHPGEDVELLCSLASISNNTVFVAWMINRLVTPYGINSLHNGLLDGYSATLVNTNLIIKDIKLNDDRNGSEYRCVILQNEIPILHESDPIILYVAGEYRFYVHNHFLDFHVQITTYVHAQYIILQLVQ